MGISATNALIIPAMRVDDAVDLSPWFAITESTSSRLSYFSSDEQVAVSTLMQGVPFTEPQV